MTEEMRKPHLWMMNVTCKTLGNILATITQEQATTWRDGGTGWTVLEVLCHLRDFNGFFHGRAVMMIEADYPHLPAYDHEALAIERRYNEQDIRQVYQELSEGRKQFITFFEGLTEAQWQRSGVHPERGHFTMLDALMQVVTHELNHTEQITRIIAEKR